MEGILPFAIGKPKTRAAHSKTPSPSKMGWPRWNLPDFPLYATLRNLEGHDFDTGSPFRYTPNITISRCPGM
jgi:hypothetical protein